MEKLIDNMDKLNILELNSKSVIYKGQEYACILRRDKVYMVTNSREYNKNPIFGDNYFSIDYSEVEEIYDYTFYCQYKNLGVRLNYIRQEKNFGVISIEEDDELYAEPKEYLIGELGMSFYPQDYDYERIINLDEITDITYEAVPRNIRQKPGTNV